MTFIEEVELALEELVVTISESTIAKFKILSEESERGKAAMQSLKRLKARAMAFKTPITIQDIRADLAKTIPQEVDDDLISAVADALEAEGANVIQPK